MSPRTPQSLAETLVRDVARHERMLRGLQNKNDLGRSSIEDSGALPVYASTGDPRASYGVQFDGSAGAFELTGPTPLKTTAPICTGGATIVVGWDGYYAGDPTLVSPMNFSRVEIHASQDPNFLADTALTLRDTFESPRGGEKTISLVEGTWHIKLVARSQSGGRGPASEGTAVTVTPILTQAELNALEQQFDADMNALSAALSKRPGPMSGTAIPTMTAPTGSIYFQRDGTGGLIGQFEQTEDDPANAGYGDTWVSRPLKSEALAGLTVDKLIATTASITTGVADKFFADIFATRRLSAQHIYVGPGANPIPDPAFMDATTTAARIARSTGPASAWTEVAGTTTRPKGIRRTTPSGGALFELWPTANAVAADIPNMVPVEEGQTWKLEVEVETSLTTGVYFMMRIARGDGSMATVQVTPTSGTVLNGRRTIVGEYVVPAGVVAMTPAVSTAASGTIFTVYGNAYMGQKTDGTLIVDNLLLGKTIIGTRLATADTGARIELNGLGSNNRLFGVNTSGVTYMDFNENGAFLKGVIEVDAPLFAQKIRLGPILIPTSQTTSDEAAGLAFFKALEPAFEKPPMITSYDGSTLVLEGRNNLTSLPGKIFIGENLDIQMHGNVFIQGNFSVPIVEASELRNATGTLPTVIARTYDAGAGVIRPGIWLSRDGSAGGDEAFIGVNADDNIIIDPPTGKNILQLGRIRLGWSTANSIIVAPSLAAFYFRNDGTSGDEKSADGAIWTPTNTNNMFVRAPSYGGSRGAFRVDTGTFLEYYDPPTSTFGANLGIASNPKDRIFKLTSNPKFKLAIEPQTLEKAKLLLKVIPVNWFDRFQAEAYAAYMTGVENVSLDDIPPLRRIPGLNAQDVLDAGLDEFVTYNHEGELEGVYYDRLWTLLIILVQHMWDQMETMQKDIQQLKKKAKF